MRRIIFYLALLCCFGSFVYAKGSHASKAPKSTKASKSGNTIHVRGYTRKDGTYVAPHDRHASTRNSISGSSVRTASTRPYRKGYIAEGLTPHASVMRDKHGRIKRSKAAKAAFERQNPCPSTGKSSGRCPGYVVDHVKPLECGGADAPGNMQWQTVANGKAKDKTEGQCRI